MTQTEVGSVEAERDEPPGAGASHRRIDEQPTSARYVSSDDGEACSIDARLTLLRQLFGARIEAVRRDLSSADRMAAVRALKEEMRAARRTIVEQSQRMVATRHEYAQTHRNTNLVVFI